eukprot:14912282-Ditylum_brightwellii.AAC.1
MTTVDSMEVAAQRLLDQITKEIDVLLLDSVVAATHHLVSLHRSAVNKVLMALQEVPKLWAKAGVSFSSLGDIVVPNIHDHLEKLVENMHSGLILLENPAENFAFSVMFQSLQGSKAGCQGRMLRRYKHAGIEPTS